MARHDLIKTGDKDAFPAIKDRNGEVVLSYCRRCKRGEGELDPECPGEPLMRCNCENEDCGHSEGCSMLAHPSGAYRVMYVGKVCMGCFYRMPEQYRIPDGANRRKAIEEFIKDVEGAGNGDK